jgi:bifunctional DNA-binding transcriptional regulator/antitoxin component of YhaV-PrlF toxin-antitoxin module
MPSLEERMVYRVGASSLAITLPPGWLRYYGIKPGDKVEVLINDVLTIQPIKK